MSDGLSTKERLMEAALATVREHGLIGTSARSIARTGDLNQALVFYHFGSVDELLIAALRRANERRLTRFAPEIEQVDDLGALVRLATELHGGRDDPDHEAIAAITAGWSDEATAAQIVEALTPWDRLVADALARCLADSPLRALLPLDDIAHLVTALFLGIEIYSRIEPPERTEQLFTTLGGLAGMAEQVLGNLGGGDA